MAMWLVPPAFGSTKIPICVGLLATVPPYRGLLRRRSIDLMSNARPSVVAVTPLSSRSAALPMPSAL